MKTSLTYLLFFCVFTCITKSQDSFLSFPELEGSENVSSWNCLADDSAFYQLGITRFYNDDYSQSVRASHLIKTNLNGETEWQYTLNDATFEFEIVSTDLLVHSNNSIYVTGFKSNYFTTASGDTSLLDTRIFLARVNSNGEEEWLRYYNLEGNIKTTADISEALDGGVLITGHNGNYVPIVIERDYSVFLFKTTEEGDYLWHNSYSDNNWGNFFDEGLQGVERSEGEYIIGARGRAVSSSHHKGMVFQSDESGSILWEEVNDGTESLSAYCTSPTFLVTQNGEIVIENCIVPPFPDRELKGRIRKLDSDFNLMWTIGIIPDVLGIREKANGNIIAFGQYPYYDEIASLLMTEDIRNLMTVIFEVSQNGELLWTRFISSQSSLGMGFRSMDVTLDGSILIGGDAIVNGKRNPLLLKLNPNGNLFQENNENTIIFLEDDVFETNFDINIIRHEVLDGVNEIEFAEMELLIDKNPFNNELKLQIPISAQTLQIYNTTGQLIYVVDDVSESDINISTSHWQSGIYFVVVKLEGGIMREKVVKQ